MFLLETRFYDIYEELPHNVTEDALLRCTVQIATRETAASTH